MIGYVPPMASGSTSFLISKSFDQVIRLSPFAKSLTDGKPIFRVSEVGKVYPISAFFNRTKSVFLFQKVDVCWLLVLLPSQRRGWVVLGFCAVQRPKLYS